MAKKLNPFTEKLLTAISMGISGYFILTSAFNFLPKLPAFFTTSIFGNISIVIIAAGWTVWGVYVLMTKY